MNTFTMPITVMVRNGMSFTVVVNVKRMRLANSRRREAASKRLCVTGMAMSGEATVAASRSATRRRFHRARGIASNRKPAYEAASNATVNPHSIARFSSM